MRHLGSNNVQWSRTSSQIRLAIAADIRTRREQVENLEGEKRELKTTVEKLLVEGKKVEEGARQRQPVRLSHPTPLFETKLRFGRPHPKLRHGWSPIGPTKRNLAKRKEQSRNGAMDVDNNNNWHR
jgi:hypothetical protein